ncbi:hypothetical protein AOG26_16135 [Pseudoalteromonas sp. UCD-33C]|nr:hypothetical protein AOG26_16135 [Pseudoalteromonas sp. UCD-33C]
MFITEKLARSIIVQNKVALFTHQNDLFTHQFSATKVNKTKPCLFFVSLNKVLKTWHETSLYKRKAIMQQKIKPNNWRTHVTIGFRFYQRK